MPKIGPWWRKKPLISWEKLGVDALNNYVFGSLTVTSMLHVLELLPHRINQLAGTGRSDAPGSRSGRLPNRGANMFRSPATVAVLLGCVLSSATSPAAGRALPTDDKEKLVQPLFSLGGRESKNARAGYHRIESPEAWKALWLRHNTGTEKPGTVPVTTPQAEVDLSRCMVVAVFQGEGDNCDGLKVHSVLETGEQMTVRIQGLYFATGPTVQKTQAWGIFVLPRSAKPLLIELDTRSDKSEPPKWTKVAEFKAGNGSLEK